MAVIGKLVLLLWVLGGGDGRIHRLVLKNEIRFLIHMNSFGFYTNGSLDVNLTSLQLRDESSDFEQFPIGFSLSKSRVDGVLSYTAEEPGTCVLNKKSSTEPLVLFVLDLKQLSVKVSVYGDHNLTITGPPKTAEGTTTAQGSRRRREGPDPRPADDAKDETKGGVTESKTGTEDKNAEPAKEKVDKKPEQKTETPNRAEKVQKMTFPLQKVNSSYNFSFHVTIGSMSEGLYNLNFHNCFNMQPAKDSPFNVSVEITERNPGGYLSASEMPLPLLYIVMSAFFFAAAIFWVYILMKHRFNVFKIHWLMAALAFTKAISLIFHSINFYCINTKGHPIEGWAVMYYITHLLKGALLFITLALIGTGWAFVKYILSDKEKKIFMIVIPLQVLANVAYIIIESTEEGTSEYALWKEILFLVDLICCGAILFPVVWSIRHLQEASGTDGKAAMNLEKLKLFRHYYVMIVCYIYFTRIIAILLKVTVPFQWQWLYEFLVEVSTLVFFVLTGYKFRPASNNPYLQLPLDEEDADVDEVMTESGVLEGISKVKKTSNGRERLRDSAV
ncbi:protein GPR108 isoform X2 [Amia ocellicauda]|uniref:protein GPR108 isoform X2 n=1 Tax=Amia ocellicauda TaxID=2972642 RepID=UPI003464112A